MDTIQLLILKAMLGLLLASSPVATLEQKQTALADGLNAVQQAQAYLNNQNVPIIATSTPEASTTTQPLAIGAPSQIITPVVASGTCEISVQIDGKKTILTSRANNNPIPKWIGLKGADAKWNNFSNQGMLYYEYTNGSNTTWSDESVQHIGGTSMMQYDINPWIYDDGIKEAVRNATNFKLVYPDGTICYANS